MTGHTIAIDRLTKRYGHTTVLDDLSFTVEPGRVTGFLGPNGAGKSTTMKILLDLASADDGTGDDRRVPLPRSARPGRHRRRRHRSQRIPSRTQRPEPLADRRRHRRHRPPSRRRDDRRGRSRARR